jgi:hypothetical protein
MLVSKFIQMTRKYGKQLLSLFKMVDVAGSISDHFMQWITEYFLYSLYTV